MTAKEYLERAYRIDQRINSKMEQAAALRSLSQKATAKLSYMSWERISVELQRSVRSVFRLHDKALRKISEKIKVGS